MILMVEYETIRSEANSVRSPALNQLEHIEAIEKSLWAAADNLRANSRYVGNEYCLPVMVLQTGSQSIMFVPNVLSFRRKDYQDCSHNS